MGQNQMDQENNNIYKTNNKCCYTGLPIYFGCCDCYIHGQRLRRDEQQWSPPVLPIRRSNSHEILQIEPPITLESVKKAYHKLCKVYHPDKPTGNHEQFIKIKNAYNELCLTC